MLSRNNLAGWIDEYQDFPSEGILFRDINPILSDPKVFRNIISDAAFHPLVKSANKIVGIESRGFLLAAPLSLWAMKPFIPVRKPGKLPGTVLSQEYNLEYGSDSLEIQVGSLSAGDSVLIVDDVLATGGTARATAELVKTTGATVTGLFCLVELTALDGRRLLEDIEVYSLLKYDN